MDIGANGALNEPADPHVAGQWMTYDELAALCGSDRLSAVKLRRGWRKQRDTRRVARVCVPINELPNRTAGLGTSATEAQPSFGNNDQETTQQVNRTATQADQTRVVERAMWREQVAREGERADNLGQERDQLLSMVKDLVPH